MSIKKIDEAVAHQPLMDILIALLNRCFTAVVVAIGSNTAKVKTTNAAQYCIDGKMYTKAGTDDLFVLSGTVIPISSFCKFLLCLDANGDASIVQGNIASTAAAALLPDCPDTKAPVGYVQVATDATHTFTPGTTALSAAGITDTYVDLSSVVTIS